MATADALYRRASYLKSAHTLSQAPLDVGFEVAFAGRSNAGKSRVINVLTSLNALARTSKTPGRTQQMVYFTLDDQRRLVDLPGYGYAKIPRRLKEHWGQVLPKYLATRDSLRGVVLIMDIRHPLKALDLDMLQWCSYAQLPVHILLNKADKLSRGRAGATLDQVRGAVTADQQAISVQLFSATKRSGQAQLYQTLNQWLSVDGGADDLVADKERPR